MFGSLLRLNSDVLHAATSNRYVDGNDISLVNLGPVALFSIYRLVTSSGKHIEEVNHARIVCLMYKLLPSSRENDDLSIGFDRSRDRRKQQLTNNKKLKRKYLVTIMLKDIFGFAHSQEKATFGLGYQLSLTGNTDNAVLNKSNGINNAKFQINSIDWYVPTYTPSLSQQKILVNQIVKKKATELHYPERSVFMKEVNTQNLWTFELGTQEGINVPIWIYVGFQQNDRQHHQNLNNDTFCRLPIVTAQGIIGKEKYPDTGILLKVNDDDYSQGYHQSKEVFRALTHDNTLQPYIGENDYRSSNDGIDIGYNIHAFDMRYQKKI